MCFLKCLTSFQIFDADHHCHHQKNFRLVILYQLPTKYTFRYWHIQSENKIFCQISDSYSFLKMNYLSSFTFFHSFYTQKNLEILVLSKNCSTIYCIICQYKINLKARNEKNTDHISISPQTNLELWVLSKNWSIYYVICQLYGYNNFNWRRAEKLLPKSNLDYLYFGKNEEDVYLFHVLIHQDKIALWLKIIQICLQSIFSLLKKNQVFEMNLRAMQCLRSSCCENLF